MSPRLAVLAVGFALLSLAVPAYGHSRGGGASPLTASREAATVSLPSPETAKQIVGVLWSQRERALNSVDMRPIDTFDAASAKAHDVVYLENVRLGDTPQLVRHPLVEVVLQIPKQSDRPVFFAQIRTTNGEIGKFVWYLVAVERERSGQWKLGFVSFGGRDTVTPPLRVFTQSDTYTPAVTADSRARIVRQAMSVAHPYRKQRTANGVVVRSHGAVRTATEGIYGLAFRGGQVLSCFTWHTIGTITYPAGVLQQHSPAYAWGHRLALGDYRSITIDKAVAQCTLGTGRPKSAEPFLVLQDLPRTASISGVRS